MNLVGKIFIGLILVMSVVFMSFAMAVYATHRNWKEEITRTAAEVKGSEQLGYQEQLREARKTNAAIKDELSKLNATLNSERLAKARALSQLETENARLTADTDKLNAELTVKTQALATQTEGLKSAQANLSNLREEVVALRQEIRTAHEETDKSFKAMLAATDTLHQKQGQLDVLTERNDQISKQVIAYRNQIIELGGQPGLDPGKLPPPTDGVVVAVMRDDMIEISIGSDDGLLNGHELDVYRGAKYLGRVRIVETRPDRAVASILKEFKEVAQDFIRKGDRVATKLRA